MKLNKLFFILIIAMLSLLALDSFCGDLGKFDDDGKSAPISKKIKTKDSKKISKNQREFRKKLIQFHLAIDTMTCTQLNEVVQTLSLIQEKEKSSNMKIYYNKAEGVAEEVYLNKGCDAEKKPNKKD